MAKTRRLPVNQRRTAPRSAGASVPPKPTRIAVWVLLSLALPRIVRILYPYVWVEDDALLESVYAVSAGLRPYLDFTHAQMPLLEWVGAAYFAVAGASHVSVEILNGAAIYATSVLLLVLGRAAVGYRAAVTGALLFAYSSLVFRYHVWAREFFVTVLVLTAALVILDENNRPSRQVVGVAALLTLACAIKLTAAVSTCALIAFMAAAQRRPLRAFAAGLATGAGLLAFAGFCYWRYGFPFVFQAFLFHFMKGRNFAGGGLAFVRQIFDVLAPLSVLGLAGLALRREWNRPLALILTMIAAAALFYGVLSPTAWGHNYLEPLPFVAIVAGVGAVWLLEVYRRSRWASAAGAALIAISLVWGAPLVNENFERGSTYGFGFVPRQELSALATGLKAASSPGEEVIAPAFVAFEANRILRVRFPENYGVMRAAQAEYDEHGFAVARARFGTRDFFALINETSAYWNDQVVAAIAVGGPVNAMIPDSPVQLLPLVNASPMALEQRGFRLSLRTAHYALWTRAPGR